MIRLLPPAFGLDTIGGLLSQRLPSALSPLPGDPGSSRARLRFLANGVSWATICVHFCHRQKEIVMPVGRVFVDGVVRGDCGRHISPRDADRR